MDENLSGRKSVRSRISSMYVHTYIDKNILIQQINSAVKIRTVLAVDKDISCAQGCTHPTHIFWSTWQLLTVSLPFQFWFQGHRSSIIEFITPSWEGRRGHASLVRTSVDGSALSAITWRCSGSQDKELQLGLADSMQSAVAWIWLL